MAASSGPRRRATAAIVLLLLLARGLAVSAQPSAGDAPETGPVSPVVDVLAAGGGGQAPVEETGDWREIIPGLRIGSQIRLRSETRRNFRFDDSAPGNDEGFLLSRLRFGLTWKPGDAVTGVVELQDARIYGEEAISETGAPNIFADQLDVHQAYVDVRSQASGRVPVTLRLGRQKIAYGSERLVSPLEWVNTARVFDGAKVGVEIGAGRVLDGFVTRLVPVTPNGINDHGPTPSRMFNSQLHGVYYTDTGLLPDATLEGYWLLRRETGAGDEVHTIGARFEGSSGPWAVDGEIATQTGSYGGEDHRATMVHVGGAYATGWPGAVTIGGAYNVGQGDDDPADGVHRTFDNLYPLNHAFYGYMDFFALQNLKNAEVTVDATLPARLTLRVGYQHFGLAEPGTDGWYNAGAGLVHRVADTAVASHVGSEVDVIVGLPLWEVTLEVGYGRFFGGDYMRDTGFASRSADFLYVQTLVGF